MDQGLLLQIREARERIEARARALRILIEYGEVGRQNRAVGVITLVQDLVVTETGISATVTSKNHKLFYPVTIRIHRQQTGQETSRGYTCTCRDSDSGGPCKHVIAVAARWIRMNTEDWNRLKKAEEALTPGSP